MKRILAGLLLGAMVITAGPVMSADAAPAVVSTAKAAKSAGVTGLKTAYDVSSTYDLTYSWKKVSGVKYQYRYKLADDADFSKVKTTKKNSAKISFESYDNVTFQVRTVKTVDGKKTVSKWTKKTLKASTIDKKLCKAMGLEDGYVKNGVRYLGGLYSTENDTNGELSVLLFNYGSVDKPTIYIVYQKGKVVDYGSLKSEEAKLSDGTVYNKLTTGDNQTYGYVFDTDPSTGYVITQAGKKLKANAADVSYAWDIQALTEG